MFVRVKSINQNGKYYSYIYLVMNYWNKEKKQARQKVILHMGKIFGLEPYKIKEVLARNGARCKNCGRQDTLTVDRITPILKGGTNKIENLQILCIRCNKKKGTKIIRY